MDAVSHISAIRSEGFALSEVLEEVKKSISSENPYYANISNRALKVCKEFLHDMVGRGLLEDRDGQLWKTNDFDMASNAIRIMSQSDVRLLAWSLHYLNRNDSDSFSIRDIKPLLSYDQQSITDTIEGTKKWKPNERNPLGVFVPIFAKDEDKLVIKEEPYGSTQTCLTMNCENRIQAAVLEISRTKQETTEDEIAEKLSAMETEAMRRALKRLKVKEEESKWVAGEDAQQEIGKEILLGFWPLYGIFYTKKSLVNVGTKKLYVDVPNGLIVERFSPTISGIVYENKGDVDRAFELSKEAASEFTKRFSEYLHTELKVDGRELTSWLSLHLIKTPLGRLQIRYHLEWKSFFAFLEEVSNSKKVKLSAQYQYLADCRGPASHFATTEETNRIQESVKSIASPDLENTLRAISDLRRRLEEARARLRRKSQRRGFALATLGYLLEAENILRSISTLARDGAVTSCYREMRKLVENLGWVGLDDLLFLNTQLGLTKAEFSQVSETFVPPYRFVNRKWFMWAKGKRFMKRFSDINVPMNKMLSPINQDWKKSKAVRSDVVKSISYPILLALTSSQIEGEIPDDVLKYDSVQMGALAQKNLSQILFRNKIKGSSVSAIAAELMKNLAESAVVPRYPSNELVLQLFDRMAGTHLYGLYDAYSTFIHSYSDTWLIFPFSSVLELKIFNSEFSRFSDEITTALNAVALSQRPVKRSV